MYISFNGQHYLQMGGTVMATSLAPNYANLVMDKYITKATNGYHLKPLLWKRLIDDTFMIWTHGEEQLEMFIKYLNANNFIHEHSLTSTTPTRSPHSIANLHTHTCTYITLQLTQRVWQLKDPMDNSSDWGEPVPWMMTLKKCKKILQYYVNRGCLLENLVNHYKNANKFSQNDLLSVTKRPHKIDL